MPLRRSERNGELLGHAARFCSCLLMGTFGATVFYIYLYTTFPTRETYGLLLDPHLEKRRQQDFHHHLDGALLWR